MLSGRHLPWPEIRVGDSAMAPDPRLSWADETLKDRIGVCLFSY